MLLPVATTCITQNVNIKSVVSKVCKMNLNKIKREMEVAEAANASCSFPLPQKSNKRYHKAY
jgi:hypothetical protein